MPCAPRGYRERLNSSSSDIWWIGFGRFNLKYMFLDTFMKGMGRRQLVGILVSGSSVARGFWAQCFDGINFKGGKSGLECNKRLT
jgi:hypothetical protein